ncbi:MAG: hypothetical protein ACREI7_08790 [Myxococcota bacterium]
MDLGSLPGGELVAKGLADRAAGRESAESLLVEVAGEKLRRLGFEVTTVAAEPAEHRLYRWLARQDPRRAHSRLNALLRQLTSFARAARCAL